jgi:hypothetical protein
VRKHDLTTTEQAGIQREGSGTEKHEGGGHERQRQRTRPVEEETRSWSARRRGEHHEGKPGHGSGTGCEEADEERCSAHDRERCCGLRRDGRCLGVHQIRSTLDSRGYPYHQAQKQQAYAGPLTRERREESLQSAPLLERRPLCTPQSE